MPITFEPAQPFASSILQGYGRSQARNDSAQNQLAQNRIMADLMLGEAQIKQRAYESGSEQLQRDRMMWEEGAQKSQGIAAQYGLSGQEISGRMAMQAAEGQQRAQLMQLEQTLREQDLTFREKQDLRQLQAGFKSVDEDPNLSAQEKYEIKALMGPKISRLMAQESVSQQKAQGEMTELHKQQRLKMEQAEADADSFRAAALKNNFTFEPDAEALPKVSAEVAALNPGLDPKSPEFQKKVQDTMKQRGLGNRWFISGGKPTMHPADESRVLAKQKGQMGGGQEVKEAELLQRSERVASQVEKWASSQETYPSAEAIQKKAVEFAKVMVQVEDVLRGGTPGAQSKEQVKLKTKEEASVIDTRIDEISKRQDITPQNQAQALNALRDLKKLTGEFRIDQRSDEINAHIQGVMDRVNSLTQPTVQETLTPGFGSNRVADINARPQNPVGGPAAGASEAVKTRVQMLKAGYREEVVFQGVSEQDKALIKQLAGR